MSSNTGKNIPKESLVKVQVACQSKGNLGASHRITIPNLGVEYYKRIIHENGRIELIPVEMMETSVGVKNGND
jgi:hypothetical protein